MNTAAEQFSVTMKENLENNLALYVKLTSAAFASMEKITDLNLSAAKASLTESSEATRKLFATKDPKEFFSLGATIVKPSIEKAIAYGHHFANITSCAHTELAEAAEIQIAINKHKAIEFLDQASKKASPATEGWATFLRSVIGIADAGYEQAVKHVRQTTEISNNVMNQVSQTVTRGSFSSEKK